MIDAIQNRTGIAQVAGTFHHERPQDRFRKRAPANARLIGDDDAQIADVPQLDQGLRHSWKQNDLIRSRNVISLLDESAVTVQKYGGAGHFTTPAQISVIRSALAAAFPSRDGRVIRADADGRTERVDHHPQPVR